MCACVGVWVCRCVSWDMPLSDSIVLHPPAELVLKTNEQGQVGYYDEFDPVTANKIKLPCERHRPFSGWSSVSGFLRYLRAREWVEEGGGAVLRRLTKGVKIVYCRLERGAKIVIVVWCVARWVNSPQSWGWDEYWGADGDMGY